MLMCAALVVAGPSRAASLPDERTMQGYTSYLEELLDLSFTAEQRETVRRQVHEYARAGNRNALNTVAGSARTWAGSRNQPAELRAAAYSMTRPDALLGLQKAARNGEADSQWLLDAYYRAHPPLAPAKPGGLALTREMVEAELGIQHWLATEIHRQRASPPDARVMEAALKHAMQQHPRLTSQQQVKRGRQTGEWAKIRYAWPRASQMDQLITRADMGARLTPQEQAAVQQVMSGFNAQLSGMMAQHRDAVLGSAIANMRQNSDTIMGRGTVWNPATNRWEQQGGIVTEYDGRVRVP